VSAEKGGREGGREGGKDRAQGSLSAIVRAFDSSAALPLLSGCERGGVGRWHARIRSILRVESWADRLNE
jgi:hypothetical protein